jgi:hypothetical protein
MIESRLSNGVVSALTASAVVAPVLASTRGSDSKRATGRPVSVEIKRVNAVTGFKPARDLEKR